MEIGGDELGEALDRAAETGEDQWSESENANAWLAIALPYATILTEGNMDGAAQQSAYYGFHAARAASKRLLGDEVMVPYPFSELPLGLKNRKGLLVKTAQEYMATKQNLRAWIEEVGRTLDLSSENAFVFYHAAALTFKSIEDMAREQFIELELPYLLHDRRGPDDLIE